MQRIEPPPPEVDVPVEDPSAISPAEAQSYVESGTLFSVGEIQLTLVILFFGLVSIVAFAVLVWGKPITPYIMRLYVIIILVFGTLLVVSSSYATSQIAPVVGFFGTIAGYLLGRTERQADDEA